MATIVLVEDNPQLIALLQDMLTEFGHIPVVTDAAGAVATALTVRPDLILLDLHLDGVGGETVFHQLRAAPTLANVPVVITSALPNALAIAKDLGADDVLLKPFGIHVLRDHVDAALARTRKLQLPEGPLS